MVEIILCSLPDTCIHAYGKTTVMQTNEQARKMKRSHIMIMRLVDVSEIEKVIIIK